MPDNRRRNALWTYPCLCLLLLLTAAPVCAQSDWKAVLQLPAGQDVKLSLRYGGQRCRIQSVTEDDLVCHRRIFLNFGRNLTIRRTEVRSVRLSRELLSSTTGGLIGLGAGAGLGAAIDASAKNQVEEGHLAAVVFALLGLFVGESVGQHTDFLAGPVIYRVP